MAMDSGLSETAMGRYGELCIATHCSDRWIRNQRPEAVAKRLSWLDRSGLWLTAQSETADLWPYAAICLVQRMVRPHILCELDRWQFRS